MKVSQNLYAETFVKTMGAAAGAPTAAGGLAAARQTLEAWGVAPGALIMVDGSGLSRYDYITPEALVTILAHVDGDRRLRDPFEAALPIAGRDGTLTRRMKGTPAEGNVRAKTGSMANVRSLAGYVTTADGEPLAFAILANDFEVPRGHRSGDRCDRGEAGGVHAPRRHRRGDNHHGGTETQAQRRHYSLAVAPK